MANTTERDRKDSGSVRWQCPLCPHHWDFDPSDSTDAGFFAVYHLANKHGLCGSDILGIDPALLAAVNDYPGWLPPEPS